MVDPSPMVSDLPRRMGSIALKISFSLLLVELLLRAVLAVAPASLHFLDYKTAEWHRDDQPEWGVWHFENTQSHHVKSCAEATYHTNAFGMRDAPRTLEKSMPRIAVLGDSFTEGYLVADNETFSQHMEHEVFDGKVEVLNFGTSGYFGTTQQWLLYENLARRFKPDLVVAAFLNENDLHDNSWSHWQTRPARRRPYLVAKANQDGFELFYPDVEPRRHRLRYTINNYLLRFSYIARVANEISLRIKYADAGPQSLEIYNTRPTKVLEEAWQITQEALRRLKEAVEKDGARLLVVQLVEEAQIHPDKAKDIEVHAGHDPLYPNRRLAEITTDLGIDLLALYETFRAYRDTHGLEPPYFSFPCDRHWSPLGHTVASEAIGKHIMEHGLLKSSK